MSAPYAIDFGDPEEMLIACCVEEPKLTDSFRATLFGDERCRHIFEFLIALRAIRGNLKAWQILHELWKKHPEMLEPVTKWVNNLPSPAGWEWWDRECREKAAARHAVFVSEQLKEPAPDLAGAARQLLKIEQAKSRISTASTASVVDETMQMIDERWASESPYAGEATGYPTVDSKTDGLTAKALWVIGARPSVGKTTLACNLATNLINRGVSTAFFTLEMPNMLINLKMMFLRAGVKHSMFRQRNLTEREAAKLSVAGGQLKSLPIHYIDSARTIQAIAAETRRLHQDHKIRVVIIDYMQKVTVENSHDDRWENISFVSNTLKNLALDTGVTVIALAQLSRKVEQEQRDPVMSDLKGSSEIEADADVIAFLHAETPQNRKLIIAKSRMGETGKIDLQCDMDVGLIEEQPRVHEQDVPKQ